MLIKVQPDATVCRHLFTAKSLHMFRVSQYPSSGVLKTVTAASGTGNNTGTATYLQRGLITECLSKLCSIGTHHGTPNLSNYNKYAAITPTRSMSTDTIEPLL